MGRRSSSSTSARAVFHDHEAAIRRVLGDRDYQLLVRYLAGSVRLLQKLEGATAAVPVRKGSKQLKMSPALNDDARRAIEALAEHLLVAFDAPSATHANAAPSKPFKLVKR
jgi:hypothetical protein